MRRTGFLPMAGKARINRRTGDFGWASSQALPFGDEPDADYWRPLFEEQTALLQALWQAWDAHRSRLAHWPTVLLVLLLTPDHARRPAPVEQADHRCHDRSPPVLQALVSSVLTAAPPTSAGVPAAV